MQVYNTRLWSRIFNSRALETRWLFLHGMLIVLVLGSYQAKRDITYSLPHHLSIRNWLIWLRGIKGPSAVLSVAVECDTFPQRQLWKNPEDVWSSSIQIKPGSDLDQARKQAPYIGFGVGGSSSHTINPFLYQSLNFNIRKELALMSGSNWCQKNSKCHLQMSFLKIISRQKCFVFFNEKIFGCSIIYSFITLKIPCAWLPCWLSSYVTSV